MASYLSYESERPGITPAVRTLLVVNVAVLFLQWTLVQESQVFAWLGFRAARLPGGWWTPITYMFVHSGLLHLALNLYMLWLFGPRLEAAMGTRRFSLFYLFSGLGGVALHWLLAPDSVLVGASAAVYGVMLGYAMTWPHEEVLLFGVVPMRVIVMVLLLTVLNLVSGLADTAMGGGGVAYFAHLGGFAFAFLWMRMPSGAAIDRLHDRIAPAPDIPTDEPPRAIPRSVRRQEPLDEADQVVRRSRAVVGPRRTPPRAQRAVAVEPEHSELDRVLDKISASGIDSLTSAERKVLDESARRLRGD